ncbi:MAG: hypothetical protein IPN29_12195 [Saprospiraceae bacterium]|nr:hypothetical protein [Saprospiraceae bacterium]
MEKKIKRWADQLYIEPQNEVWDDITHRMKSQSIKKPKTRQIGLMVLTAASFTLVIVSFLTILWPNSTGQSHWVLTSNKEVKPTHLEVLDLKDASIYVSQTQIHDLRQAYTRLSN